jgi:hypothetical protein
MLSIVNRGTFFCVAFGGKLETLPCSPNYVRSTCCLSSFVFPLSPTFPLRRRALSLLPSRARRRDEYAHHDCQLPPGVRCAVQWHAVLFYGMVLRNPSRLSSFLFPPHPIATKKGRRQQPLCLSIRYAEIRE